MNEHPDIRPEDMSDIPILAIFGESSDGVNTLSSNLGFPDLLSSWNGAADEFVFAEAWLSNPGSSSNLLTPWSE